MKEEEFLEQIYNRIPKNLEGKEQIILAIYIELGKRTNYMAKYHYENDYEKECMYHNKDFVFENGKNIAICTLISKYQQELEKRFGIESEIIKDTRDEYACPSAPHVYLVSKLEDGKELKTDLTKDLYRIPLKKQLRHFGSNPGTKEHPLKKYSSDELYKLCAKAGYIKFKNGYTDKIWSTLRTTLLLGDGDSNDKLMYALKKPLEYPEFSSLGPVERERFYDSLFFNMRKELRKNKGNLNCFIDDIKITNTRKKFLPKDPSHKSIIPKADYRNSAYNAIYSVLDKYGKPHHYMQNNGELMHFGTEELEDYIDENRIAIYSPIPFIEREYDD